MTYVQYAVFGLAIGAVFALLAVGIVLVYRASGVLNFAHASMGTAAAYVNFELLERYDWLPVGAALVVAIAFGAALGVVVHRVAFVPVARASQVVKLLVSFGVAGVVQGAVGLAWGPLGTPSAFGHSLLPLTDGVSIAGAVIPYQRLALVVVGVVAGVGLAVLLSRTGFGVQVRALAQNPLAARLSGIEDRRIERTTWAIAGGSAALAAVLVVPFGAMSPLALSGIQLKALAAALVGGFVSAGAALAGGLGLGLAQELLVGAPSPFNGFRGAIATALVLVLLVVRVERFFVSDQEARALEGEERTAVRGARVPLFGEPRWWLLAAAPVALVIAGQSGFWASISANTMIYALLGLSLVVLTGWSGQVSLMPGTFAGVGACLAWVLDTRLGFPMALVVPLAALATVPVCAVVGVAALRLRKNAVTLVIAGDAVMSQYVGDLEHVSAYEAFTQTASDLLAMYQLDVGDLLVAHDAHPSYLSTAFAGELPGAGRLAVQHHRAHIASVLAEHQAFDRRVVGIAFDGTGYGDDGTIWGGEFFVGSVRAGLTHAAALKPYPLPGGDAAARWPVQAAAGVLYPLGDLSELTASPGFGERYDQSQRAIKQGVRTFTCTSAGRLFDAVAALLGFPSDVNEYEGQAAEWLERLACEDAHAEVLPFTLNDRHIDLDDTLRAVVERRAKRVDVRRIARDFHETVAASIAAMATRLCDEHHTDIVVLSGGTFQNALLVSSIRRRLASRITVWMNRAVPPNDGGVSLGQAAIAAVAGDHLAS